MKRYIKNEKECLLCHSRKKLIQITPEEIVRQEFIQRLINDYDVPSQFIEVEIPLSYYKKGKKGRVDILVSRIDKKTKDILPLIVVECKAPHIHITDKVFLQTLKYESFLLPKIMIMTNGNETRTFSWNEQNKIYDELKFIPKYKDITTNKDFQIKEIEEQKWIRPDYAESIEINHEKLYDWGWIGEETPKEMVPFITNLTGFLYDESQTVENLPIKNKKFSEDGGIRYTTFGNAGGGSFTGDYRCFFVENEKSETEIVSFSVMGKISTKDHPKWGRSIGYTLFNVAIDNFENSHMSLEYSLDRFVKIKNNEYHFWHDGTLTVGKKGRAKNKEVLDFIKNNAPHLIKDGKIYLGKIKNDKMITWQNEDAKDLISNFIDYGFVRDDFRKTKY